MIDLTVRCRLLFTLRGAGRELGERFGGADPYIDERFLDENWIDLDFKKVIRF